MLLLPSLGELRISSMLTVDSDRRTDVVAAAVVAVAVDVTQMLGFKTLVSAMAERTQWRYLKEQATVPCLMTVISVARVRQQLYSILEQPGSYKSTGF